MLFFYYILIELFSFYMQIVPFFTLLFVFVKGWDKGIDQNVAVQSYVHSVFLLFKGRNELIRSNIYLRAL